MVALTRKKLSLTMWPPKKWLSIGPPCIKPDFPNTLNITALLTFFRVESIAASMTCIMFWTNLKEFRDQRRNLKNKNRTVRDNLYLKFHPTPPPLRKMTWRLLPGYNSEDTSSLFGRILNSLFAKSPQSLFPKQFIYTSFNLPKEESTYN